MLIANLIRYFDERTQLHIDVNDVRDKLVELGVEDEITFHFPDMDPGKIRGMLDRWERPNGVYADPVSVADIIIASDMGDEDECWKRLVAVKELLHLADCINVSAESEDAVNILFHNFSLPPELRYSQPHGAKNTKSYLNDNTRFYLALAVLVPKGCRDILRPFYGHQLKDTTIADFARIPERYVSEIMSENFDNVIAAFLDWETGAQSPSSAT